MLQNDLYLHRRSSLLFPVKICFDRIFVLGIFLGGFNRRCSSYYQAVFSKLYGKHFLMWPPLWYNCKLAKCIPLFLDPYPFIQKSRWLLFSSWSNLNLWLSQELFLSTNLHNVICMYILLCPGRYFRYFWVSTCVCCWDPRTLSLDTRASSNEFFPPYTRLNSLIPPILE